MSLRATEYAIDDDVDGGVITIRRENARNVLRFPCGEQREFSDDDLAHTLACIEALTDAPDVWLKLTDSDTRSFAVRTMDGKIEMEPSVPYGRGDDDTLQRRSASLDDLKEAFRTLANTDKTEEQASA